MIHRGLMLTLLSPAMKTPLGKKESYMIFIFREEEGHFLCLNN